MKRFAPILVIALALLSCHKQQLPEGVLSHEQMTGFLADAYRLESYNLVMYRGNTEVMAPEVRAAYTDILNRQGITQDEVETSLKYYSNHPDEYKEILDEVATRIGIK